MRRFFLAADGRLHLFWRLFTYTILLFASLILGQAVGSLGGRTSLAGVQVGTVISTTVAVGCLLLVTFLYRRYLDRRSWGDLGLSDRPLRAFGLLAGGMAVGILMMGLIFGVELAGGWVRITGYEVTRSGLGLTIMGLVAGVMVHLVPGVTEETAMRGYWYQNLAEGRPVWSAALLTGLWWGLLHVDSFGIRIPFLVLVVAAIVISTAQVITRWLTGSLWFAIGWHTAWNFAQDYLFGISTYGDRNLHSLIHLERLPGAPAWFLGGSHMPEEGVLNLLLSLAWLGVLVAWAAWRRRPVPWKQRPEEPLRQSA